MLRSSQGFGGRFVTKLFALFMLWGFGMFAVYQLRTINLEVNVPHLNSRFLLQKKLESNFRIEPTTEIYELEPIVDKRPKMSEDKLIEDIQKRMPNLPIVYWNKNKGKPMGLNKTCAK